MSNEFSVRNNAASLNTVTASTVTASTMNTTDMYTTDVYTTNITSTNVNTDTVTTDSVTTDSVDTDTLSSNNLSGIGTLFQVVVYAPTEFATLSGAQTVFLNNIPSATDATAVTDSRLLLLANGAQILSIQASNNGTTVTGTNSFGGPTCVIGTNTWSASPSSSNNLLNNITTAKFNSGVVAGTTSSSALGSTGTDLTRVAVTNSTTGITVSNTAFDTILTGDAVFIITYLLE